MRLGGNPDGRPGAADIEAAEAAVGAALEAGIRARARGAKLP
jgi:hypothetical protein